MKLRELRQLAGEATPGPWRVNRSGIDQNGFEFIEISTDEDANVEIALLPTRRDESRSDAKYIAACSPEVIQALCDAAGALRGVNVELCSMISPPFDEATAESFPAEPNIADRDAMRAALALTRAALTALRESGIEP